MLNIQTSIDDHQSKGEWIYKSAAAREVVKSQVIIGYYPISGVLYSPAYSTSLGDINDFIDKTCSLQAFVYVIHTMASEDFKPLG